MSDVLGFTGNALFILSTRYLEDAVNNNRKPLKGCNFNDVDSGTYNYQLGVYYMDFISECKKLGDFDTQYYFFHAR